MGSYRAASKRISQERLQRLYQLVDELSQFAASLTDAQLAYLILEFNDVNAGGEGVYLWQQVAQTELACRRAAQGKR